jgi:hypothetical protein
MDPGRKKIEPRRWDHLAVGNVYYTDAGQQFEITAIGGRYPTRTTMFLGLFVVPVARSIISKPETEVKMPVHAEVRVKTDNGATH